MPLSAPGIPYSLIGAANGVAQLDGTSKVPLAELPTNSRQFKGAWNASTNTPTLVNGIGTAGDEYVCTVAGSQNFGAGVVAFVVGDCVAYNGTGWEKVPPEYPVTEVNGKTGAIDLQAADVGALPLSGGVMTGPSQIMVSVNGNKLWIGKYNSGTGHTNAPTVFDATANYLQIGGREYGNLGYSGIGFGYLGDPTQSPCVMIGHQETNTAGNTFGDFLVATRSVTTNTLPTIRLRITSGGQICAEGLGTVAAPAFSFASDHGTGMFTPGTSILAFAAGGAEKLRISSTGPTFNGNLLPANSTQQNVGGPNAQLLHAYVNSVIQAPAVINSNGSFTDQDPDEIFMDATSGNLTAQIAMGSTSEGKRFLFKKVDASSNTATVSLSAGTIDGAGSVVLSARYQWVEIRIISALVAYIIGKG